MKAAVLAALMVAGSLPLSGQTNTKLRAEIPFAFEVSNRLMPAGTYTLGFLSSTSQPVVCLKDEKDQFRAAALAQSLWNPQGLDMAPALIFNRYGDRHFLAGLAWPGRKFEVMKSGNEKALVTSRVLQAAKRVEVRVVAQVR